MGVVHDLIANHESDKDGTSKALLDLNPEELETETLPSYY